MKLQSSQRGAVKLKMAIQGASGAGKTYSSLLLAKGFTNDLSKVAVIDTEQGSSHLYCNIGNYKVLTLKPPFTPKNYAKAIDICINEGIELIIIDGISPCWNYLLDYHASLSGNSFRNWRTVSKLQDEFIQTLLQAPVHIIATMRAKQGYVLNLVNGKHIPEKKGLKAVQRNGIDYEFTLAFNLDNKHGCTTLKDRTGLFANTNPFIINADTGKKLYHWCNNSKSIEAIKQEIQACGNLNVLKELYEDNSHLKPQIHELVIKRKTELENTSNTLSQ